MRKPFSDFRLLLQFAKSQTPFIVQHEEIAHAQSDSSNDHLPFKRHSYVDALNDSSRSGSHMIMMRVSLFESIGGLYKKVSPMLVKDVDEATFQKPYFGGKHLDARRPETLRLKCPRRPILTIAPSLSDHGEPCGWIFRSAQTGNHLKIEVSLYRRKDPVTPINNGAHVQTRCYSLWIRDRILCLS